MVTEQIANLCEAGVTDFVAGEFARGADAERAPALLASLVARGATAGQR
jgi:hypothetical protein